MGAAPAITMADGAYPSYGYYSGSPYSNWGYGTSGISYPYSYYGGGYPYSGYNNYFTRTTRQRTAITDQWLQLCSGVLADSVTTTA